LSVGDTGQFYGHSTFPDVGPSAEIGYWSTGGYAFVQAYDRGESARVPLHLLGSTFTVKTGTSNDSRLTINTSGNVAMGGETTSARLSLYQGDVNGSQIRMINNAAGGGEWVNGVGSSSSTTSIVTGGNLFWWNGSTKMTLAGNGNLGIGTISPSSKLELRTDTLWGTAVNNTLTITNVGSAGNINNNHSLGNILFKSVTSSAASIEAFRTNPGAGNGTDLAFSTNVGGSSAVVTERMRITQAGNVGIGTASPLSKLHIIGTHASNVSKMRFRAGSDDGVLIEKVDNIDVDTGLYLQASSNTGIFMATGGGNVGIGTTAPSTKLDLNGNMAIRGSNALHFGQTNDSLGTWKTKQFANGSTHVFNAQAFLFNNDGYGSTWSTVINSTGVGIGTTSPAQKLDVVGNARVSGQYQYGANAYTEYNATDKSIDFVFTD
jgi:hypothetical protein